MPHVIINKQKQRRFAFENVTNNNSMPVEKKSNKLRKYKVPPVVEEKRFTFTPSKVEIQIPFDEFEYTPEYVHDIYVYHSELESDPDNQVQDYLSTRSHSITEKMRLILVNWLVQVQEEFQLLHETLYKSVILHDLYLSKVARSVRMEEYQLIGACCLWIACKNEEIYPPPLSSFMALCDQIYSKKEFILLEREILYTTDFRVSLPSAYGLSRLLNKLIDGDMVTLNLIRYICELSLLSYKCSMFKPSKVASAAVYMASLMLGKESWQWNVESFTGYSLADFDVEVRKLNNFLVEEALSSNPSHVTRKYSHSIFYKVAETEPVHLENIISY